MTEENEEIWKQRLDEYSQTQQRLYHELIRIQQQVDRLVREFGATLNDGEEPSSRVINYNPTTGETEIAEPVKMNKGR